MSSSKNEKINEQMTRVCPDLASQYAKYPLKRQAWLSIDGTIGNESSSSPTASTISAFLPAKDDGVPDSKPDYVYGHGEKGLGYYHLLTRNSYEILHKRLYSQTGPISCCCFGSPRDEVDAWDTTKGIVYNRSVASRPDDVLGAQEALEIAKGKAKAVYNVTQNEQLVLNAVSLAT
mmetsp:Transcript_7674/g.9462  ORF Transcript_7674/g.9462 Transcript_7674/m.9462 type:complete len:176 (+) Transcript_7674:87-614(+)|eukprot:CAMPEP_0172480464 /NCGR_PEP_ID=MMETSP1066-20121228/5587_1 /TAXON_ID=671091 /ORGANISM="Coscinodiscus wailesii, Strain CCMP2513" /LENGTH=175 /DNA_ID=CAMNT_0013241769 /DNA_START=120 /DNA_END=647 /DNA_ORIENTATION=+